MFISIDSKLMFTIIGILSVIMVIIIVFLITKKKNSKSVEKRISKEELERIVNAIGIDNILELSIEQQRLRLVLKDIKKVNAKELTELKIPAFLKGNELKLLIKNNSKEVYKYLEEKIQ